MNLKIGDIVGDYEVLGVLGVGGMGEVYEVRNTLTDRHEAIKVLLPELAGNEELAERFQREIRLHGKLEHPNIAGVRTAFHDGNRLILVMELVNGRTLADVLDDGATPIGKRLDYIDQVLSALEYFHQQDVIHRDIKPANIMVTPDGVAKVMDFGVAKFEADNSLTQTGLTIGSLFYMSPEQIQGSQDLDTRSDIYSAGIVTYEALTGQRPFSGDSEFAVMAAHTDAAPVPPAEIDASIPAGLNDVVLMAISKDPAKRFQTAKAFQNALRSVAAGLLEPETAPIAASPAPPAAEAAAEAPPLPSEPVSPTPQGAQVPAAKPKSGMRLAYMLIGALAAVAVLAVGITQIPKWVTTQASPETLEGADTRTTEASTAPVETTTESALPPDPPVAAAQPASSAAPVESEDAPSPRASSPQTTAAKPAPRSETVQAPAPRVSAPGAPANPEPRPAKQEDPPLRVEDTTGFQQAQAAARAQREEEARDAMRAALNEQNERAIMMATRVSAVGAALTQLEREQAAMGLSLRSDMTSARSLLQTRLDQADAAIEAGDPAGAKKYLDQAEQALRKLERFLNI